VEELNATGGVLGREVRLVVVDGGAPAERVAAEVEVLVSMRAVDAVVGWHTSAVRKALLPRIAGRVPYIYTAQYEGGERTPGVFLTGETDAAQLLPAMRLLTEATGVRRWCTVGNDYVWPRVTARAAPWSAAAGCATRCSCRWGPTSSGRCCGASSGARRTPS
jgi:ABC-type branched-subunit amino acid transport system substrate-binding protein